MGQAKSGALSLEVPRRCRSAAWIALPSRNSPPRRSLRASCGARRALHAAVAESTSPSHRLLLSGYHVGGAVDRLHGYARRAAPARRPASSSSSRRRCLEQVHDRSHPLARRHRWHKSAAARDQLAARAGRNKGVGTPLAIGGLDRGRNPRNMFMFLLSRAPSALSLNIESVRQPAHWTLLLGRCRPATSQGEDRFQASSPDSDARREAEWVRRYFSTPSSPRDVRRHRSGRQRSRTRRLTGRRRRR